MFKESKLKSATRRVKNNKARKNVRTKHNRDSVWNRVWNIISWPFRTIPRIARHVWSWIRSIDLIGLVNLTLLVAIIVLFSMLIIDIVACRQKTVVFVDDTPAIVVGAEHPQVSVTDTPAPADIQAKAISKTTLPLRRDAETRKFIDAPISVKKTQKNNATENQNIQGDVTVDRNPDSPVLHNGVTIDGNLYLQNMRKYILPCGAVINGNLFLRDVDILQFCGDFTVTGNIYVSPRSSFGPIPSTARVGGYIIL